MFLFPAFITLCSSELESGIIFLQSEELLTFLVYWEHIFSVFVCLGMSLFHHHFWRVSLGFHCSWWEVCCQSHFCSQVCNISFFSLQLLLRVLSLSLEFSSLIVMYVSVVFFVVRLFVVNWDFWICRVISFIKILENVLLYSFIFYVPPLLSSCLPELQLHLS